MNCAATQVGAYINDTARLLNHFTHSSHSRLDLVDECVALA